MQERNRENDRNKSEAKVTRPLVTGHLTLIMKLVTDLIRIDVGSNKVDLGLHRRSWEETDEQTTKSIT